jgi:hypothetical protein
MDRDALEKYLNDHLAGSVVGLDIAKRCASRSDDPELQDALRGVVEQIERDQEYLRLVMDDLGFHLSVTKEAAAIAGTWAGWVRNKWFTQEALGQLEDLEALCIGVWGKRLLWGALGRVAEQDKDTALDGPELDRRAASAEAQEKELLRLRDLSMARLLSSA